MLEFMERHLQNRADAILHSANRSRMLFFQEVSRQIREPIHGCFNHNDGREGVGHLFIATPRSTQVRVQSTPRGLRRGIVCSSLCMLKLHYFSGWYFDPDLPDAFTPTVPGCFLSLDKLDYPADSYRDDVGYHLVPEHEPESLPLLLGSTWILVQLILDDPDTFCNAIVRNQ
jgi:hypothetical protein